ncbi:hypothetical protein SAMN05660477_01020 [Soonwooa buanensis]|uniref:DUF4270 domain-containing protein n=1 Tax=Soonwooa buanensis TaxID=619805 RepID=A0A1T5DTW3_9FLAO|nr:hypothetical protein [Soonwooa buanensis]SKB75252.1 hypothetical protein SAMN05660477_01020 [Soonwooa buanensis]
MKRNFTSFILLSAVMQLNAQVGINTTSPKATFDVTGNPDSLTKIDGIIAPRLTGVQLKAKDAAYTVEQKASIVYVTTGLVATETSPKTSNVTTEGYYYFDGVIWQKYATGSSINNIWVRQNDDKDIALIYPLGKETERYSQNGHKIVDIDDVFYKSSSSDLSTDISMNSTNGNDYFLRKMKSSDFVTNNPNLPESLRKEVTVVDKDDNSNSTGRYFHQYDLLQSAPDNTRNFQYLYTQYSVADHMGQGEVGFLSGLVSNGILRKSSKARRIFGTYSQATSFSDEEVLFLKGAYNFASPRGTGKITEVIGSHNFVYNFAKATSSAIDNVSATLSETSLDDKSTGQIQDLYGHRIVNNVTTNPVTNTYGERITSTVSNTVNHFGLYIDNISTGTNKWSIYSNGGSSYFKDNVGIGTDAPNKALHVKSSSDPLRLEGLQEGTASNALLVADANGVVKTMMPTQMSTMPQYFYVPSIVLPTSLLDVSTSNTDDIYYTPLSDTYTVKLYNIYQKQFGMVGDVSGANRTALRSNASSVLKTFASSELDYFVTYFDNSVFDPASIALSPEGVLTYKIITNSKPTEKTFMNIVFKVK